MHVASTRSCHGVVKKKMSIRNYVDDQAVVLHRWMQWLLCCKLTDKPQIVLNMDETSMLSPVDKRRGIFNRLIVTSPRKFAFKRTGVRRCTLMAVVSSRPDLQPHLPQVLLPRSPRGDEPGHRAKRVYETLGAPVEAWHKSSGHINAGVMKMWMKSIVEVVRKKCGDVHIILAMDCHPNHISEKTLKAAKSFDVHILPVPARSTWFLQPLDVKVFHHLKRRLRAHLMAAENNVQNATLTWTDHLQAIRSSVHRTLVQRSYGVEMESMGMSPFGLPSSPDLAKLLEGQDLFPRPPSTEDLRYVLPRTRKVTGGTNWTSLLRLTEALPASSSSSAASSAAHLSESRMAAAPTQEATQIPSQKRDRPDRARFFDPAHHCPDGIVRLSSRARLPPAANRNVEPEVEPLTGPAAGTRSRTAQGENSQQRPAAL